MRAALTLLLILTVTPAAAQRRPVTIDDQFRFADVGDPQLSPDGEWIAYTVTTTDVAADRRTPTSGK